MSCTISHAEWLDRIKDSRTRRELYESNWAEYARLHTNAYLAHAQANDQEDVVLPNGDQVKIGLVHSNIEQTMALLEVPEIGVRATALDYTAELGEEDTHREAVVEQGLYNSLARSGLLKGAEDVDHIKRDAVIIGHGINYTWWRIEEEEVEDEPAVVMVEAEDGSFVPVLDEATGAPQIEQRMTTQVWYEAVEDSHISPLEFLFDATARRMDKSPWHGYERPMPLTEARKRYPEIPADVKGIKVSRRDIYGKEGVTENEIEDAVVVIKLWDRENKELITFIEHQTPPTIGAQKKKKGKRAEDDRIGLTLVEFKKWPVRFSHPDDSPFTFFIPIPANDTPFGISQIEHIRTPALEADKLRTRVANLTRQMKIVLLYQKGRIGKTQLETALRAPEASAIAVDVQENETWGDLFKEIQPSKIPPEIYKQIVQAKEDVRNVSGISEVPFGGSETATESDNQMQIGGARPKRKKRLYMSFLTEVAKRHRDFLRTFGPEGETIPIVTLDGVAVNLQYGRAAFDGLFEIEVLPGGGAMAASPVKQKMMVELSDRIVGKINPMVDLIFLRQTLTQLDVRDINAIMRAARMPPPGMAPPGLPGGGSQPAINLNDQTNAQTIRAGINAPNEGRIGK